MIHAKNQSFEKYCLLQNYKYSLGIHILCFLTFYQGKAGVRSIEIVILNPKNLKHTSANGPKMVLK